MNAYLNERSLEHPAGSSTDPWPLIDALIDVADKLRDDYDIEIIKVPATIKSINLGNSWTIEALEKMPFEHQNFNRIMQLTNFLANRTTSIIPEVEESIEAEMVAKNAWGTIIFQKQESILLTGAYNLEKPVISLRANGYCLDFLECTFRLAYDKKNFDKEEALVNLHEHNQMDVHAVMLARIKRDTRYRHSEWGPGEKPIWNDRTPDLLKRLEFPEGISKAKNKIDALLTVGKNVAEFNGWEKDDYLSQINSSGKKIRSIFKSIGSVETWYLSIDIKNPKGTFELLNRKGHHRGEVSFQDGSFIPRGDDKRGIDTSGKHDIILRREKKKPRKKHD